MNPIESILENKAHRLFVAAPDDMVVEAVEAMCAAHIGSLLVMEGTTLCGIFCERDLMTRVVLARRDPSLTRVQEVMTRDVVCIAPDLPVRDAMKLITTRRVRHLPVVDRGRIIGLVSIGDLVRWTAEESVHAIEDGQHQVFELTEYVAGRYPG